MTAPTDQLRDYAERLARDLWGDDAWTLAHVSEPGGDYPLIDNCWCASAHRSRRGGDLVSIHVNYLPTRDAALRALCAALIAALGAAAGADRVAMAACGAEGVDAQGSEVPHVSR